MSDAQDQPAPRPRRRKLRLALVSLTLLAAFLVLLFLPSRPDAGSPVRLQFQSLITNAGHQVEAVFVTSNGWPRRVELWGVGVGGKDGSRWIDRYMHSTTSLTLLPGEVAEVKVDVLNPGSPWRVRVVWIAHSSRLRILGWDLRATVGRMVPRVAPDPAAWFNHHARTNHWPEPAR